MKFAWCLIQPRRSPIARKLSNILTMDVHVQVLAGALVANFQSGLNRDPESIARKFRDLYMRELERQRINGSQSSIPSVLNLPVKNRGRPLMLGNFDAQVQE